MLKPLMYSFFKKLKCKNGETLVESILSLMLLSVMMLTVTSMVSVSFKGLDASIRASRQNQNFVNEAALDNENFETQTVKLAFKDEAKGINSYVDVRVFSGEGFLSFAPGEGGN